MKKPVIRLIKIYQNNSLLSWFVSPFVSYSECKFHPSCSEYTIQAIEKHGLLAGLTKGSRRVLKCNPFSKGGVDLP